MLVKYSLPTARWAAKKVNRSFFFLWKGNATHRQGVATVWVVGGDLGVAFLNRHGEGTTLNYFFLLSIFGLKMLSFSKNYNFGT